MSEPDGVKADGEDAIMHTTDQSVMFEMDGKASGFEKTAPSCECDVYFSHAGAIWKPDDDYGAPHRSVPMNIRFNRMRCSPRGSGPL